MARASSSDPRKPACVPFIRQAGQEGVPPLPAWPDALSAPAPDLSACGAPTRYPAQFLPSCAPRRGMPRERSKCALSVSAAKQGHLGSGLLGWQELPQPDRLDGVLVQRQRSRDACCSPGPPDRRLGRNCPRYKSPQPGIGRAIPYFETIKKEKKVLVKLQPFFSSQFAVWLHSWTSRFSPTCGARGWKVLYADKCYD